MDTYTFNDALAGHSITCEFPQLGGFQIENTVCASGATSLFFPGCSLINFGLPLVEAVYQTLVEAGIVEGISLLCCGKIVSYEPHGEAVRASFEEQLRETLIAAGTKRMVTACPNCVVALRSMLGADVRTQDIRVDALPAVLAQAGYRIDAAPVTRLVADASGIAPADVRVGIHDSCPDRDRGEFADGLRALMPERLVVQGGHGRGRSLCCGSILRAHGKDSAADALARKHGEDARTVGASALVTVCASCALQLNVSQSAVPVFHYLELLYDWRIPWAQTSAYAKLRFLFTKTLQELEGTGGSRTFAAADEVRSGNEELRS